MASFPGAADFYPGPGLAQCVALPQTARITPANPAARKMVPKNEKTDAKHAPMQPATRDAHGGFVSERRCARATGISFRLGRIAGGAASALRAKSAKRLRRRGAKSRSRRDAERGHLEPRGAGARPVHRQHIQHGGETLLRKAWFSGSD